MNMNFSIDWTELSIQWMLTCGHFLWQGFAIALVFFAIERLAVKRTSTRYALGCAALLSLPICVMLTFGVVHNSRGVIVRTTIPLIDNAVSLNDSIATRSPTMKLDSPIDNLGNATAIPQTISNAGDRPVAYIAVTQQPASFTQRAKFLAPIASAAYAIVVGLLLLRMSLSLLGSCFSKTKSSGSGKESPRLPKTGWLVLGLRSESAFKSRSSATHRRIPRSKISAMDRKRTDVGSFGSWSSAGRESRE